LGVEGILRGACIRVKRFGTPGNASRKSQVRRRILKKGSDYYHRVHRGPDTVAARRRETQGFYNTLD